MPDNPLGKAITMLVALQLLAVAATPPNVTVLVPCVAPKFVPTIVTTVPVAPERGDMPVMAGPVDWVALIAVISEDVEFPTAVKPGPSTI